MKPYSFGALCYHNLFFAVAFSYKHCSGLYHITLYPLYKFQRVMLNDPSQWPDCTLSRPALGSAGPTDS